MFPLLASSPAQLSTELVAETVVLRTPAIQDYREWRMLREQSQAHLTAWEDAWTGDAITARAFKRRIDYWEKLRRSRAGLSYFVTDVACGALVGGVTLMNIRYGASQSGVIGYWVGSAHTRRGYGCAAVARLVDYAFNGVGLNRIEAACQPENEPSRRLLVKLGFCREGLARDYLKINGSWRDHEIFALTASHYASGGEKIAS